MTDNETVYTVKEVAELLKLSEKHIRRSIDSEELRVQRYGRAVRIPQSALNEWRDR